MSQVSLERNPGQATARRWYLDLQNRLARNLLFAITPVAGLTALASPIHDPLPQAWPFILRRAVQPQGPSSPPPRAGRASAASARFGDGSAS